MRDYDSAVSSFDYLQLAAQDLHGELKALNACAQSWPKVTASARRCAVMMKPV